MTTPVGEQDNMLGSKSSESSEEEGIVSKKALASLGIVNEDAQIIETGKGKQLDDSSKKSRYVYRDYSRVRPTPESLFLQEHQLQQQRDSSSLRSLKLPGKLHAMLQLPEFEHIISWMPHGRSWKVHSAHLFVEHVMPRFFEYSNYNSFIRLINAWGFRRLTKGRDRNAYWHELFLRGIPHLHIKMHRLTQHEKKLPLDPDDEPDLYRISELFPLPAHPTSAQDPFANVFGGGSGANDASSLRGQQLLIQQSNAAAASLFQASSLSEQTLQHEALRQQQQDQTSQAGFRGMILDTGSMTAHQPQGIGISAFSQSRFAGHGSEQQQHQQQAMALRQHQQQLDQLRQLEQLRQQHEQLLNLRRLAGCQEQLENPAQYQEMFTHGNVPQNAIANAESVSNLQAPFSGSISTSDDLALLLQSFQPQLQQSTGIQQSIPDTSMQQQLSTQNSSPTPAFDSVMAELLAQLQERNQRQFQSKP